MLIKVIKIKIDFEKVKENKRNTTDYINNVPLFMKREKKRKSRNDPRYFSYIH